MLIVTKKYCLQEQCLTEVTTIHFQGKGIATTGTQAWDLASHSVKGKGLLLSNWCGKNLIGEESKA